MSRFLVDPSDIHGHTVCLRDAESHHLKDVLRFQPGDQVVVFDGEGNEYACQIETLSKKETHLTILEKLPQKKTSQTQVALAHTVTRGERFDWVVEKGTELGVAKIIPFICQRMSVALTNIAKKEERWGRLAQAASKQSGRLTVPSIEPVLPFEEMLKQFKDYDLVLLAYELEEKINLKQVMKNKKPQRILAIVGPEGGFSKEEVEQMKRLGAQSVSLGETILRTETAAIAMLAMLFYELMK